MRKDGFASIQVGKTGTGKTHFVSNILENVYQNDENRDILVYDINNEHKKYYPFPFQSDLDIFMNEIENVKNSFIFIEEASIFFQTHGVDKKLKSLLVRKRHDNNIIYLNFHSFGMIPTYIFHLINYITVFKTNDSLKSVKSKFDNEKLLKAFEFVNNSKEKYERKTVSLY